MLLHNVCSPIWSYIHKNEMILCTRMIPETSMVLARGSCQRPWLPLREPSALIWGSSSEIIINLSWLPAPGLDATAKGPKAINDLRIYNPESAMASLRIGNFLSLGINDTARGCWPAKCSELSKVMKAGAKDDLRALAFLRCFSWRWCTKSVLSSRVKLRSNFWW